MYYVVVFVFVCYIETEIDNIHARHDNRIGDNRTFQTKIVPTSHIKNLCYCKASIEGYDVVRNCTLHLSGVFYLPLLAVESYC